MPLCTTTLTPTYKRYNEMCPAVLALADAVDKEVVVVEYDPMKLNTIEKLYSEDKRRQDAKECRHCGRFVRIIVF